MKKHISLIAVLLFVVALASLVATVKFGHPGKGGFGGYGFSNGG